MKKKKKKLIVKQTLNFSLKKNLRKQKVFSKFSLVFYFFFILYFKIIFKDLNKNLKLCNHNINFEESCSCEVRQLLHIKLNYADSPIKCH